MTAVLEALPSLRSTYAGGSGEDSLAEVRRIIEHHIKNRPRSLQKRIGPSSLGMECLHCLGAKLAEWDEQDYNGAAFLPWIGSAVHRALEDVFVEHENQRNAVHTTGLRWVSEGRVVVGTVGGREIDGTFDLLDVVTGTVIDFKLVGANTLRAAKAGPSPTYRAQAHLYARGLNDAGIRVDTVAIAYLPRNAVSLDSAVWWHEPHDRGLADAVLARADRVAANLAALEEAAGVEARDAWITSLPRAEGCFSCQKFPDRPTAARPFDDLLA